MTESLSDRIAGILSAAPTSFDPEDDIHEETTARVVEKVNDLESDEETALSSFRKQNVQLLEDIDERYHGKKSSRKNLLGSDDDDEEEDEEEEKEEEESLPDINVAKIQSDDNISENESVEKANEDRSFEEASDDQSFEEASDDKSIEEASEDESIEEASEDDSAASEDESDNHGNEGFDEMDLDDKNFKHMKESNVSTEVRKGLCVRQQLSVWESLLEARIQFQKCLLTANKLPQTDTFNEIKEKSEPEFSKTVSETKKTVSNLLDKLLYLQLLFIRKYPETKNLLSNKTQDDEIKPDDDEEIPSDTEDEEESKDNSESEGEDGEKAVPRKKMKMNEYESEISKRYNSYKSYKNSVIKKWDDKTRLVNNKPGNVVHSVLNQIDHILNDKQKLIKRTQLKRTDYEILGHPNVETSEEYNDNIFDDTDFYHQLLRELIEHKSADITDPVQLGRQWIQLQNLRSKMKRNVDTRATKGRKIRYVVHTKLVNFMAPIDESTWQDEAKTELYSSLFGRNQPVNKI